MQGLLQQYRREADLPACLLFVHDRRSPTMDYIPSSTIVPALAGGIIDPYPTAIQRRSPDKAKQSGTMAAIGPGFR